jgi:hypothetical protein
MVPKSRFAALAAVTGIILLSAVLDEASAKGGGGFRGGGRFARSSYLYSHRAHGNYGYGYGYAGFAPDVAPTVYYVDGPAVQSTPVPPRVLTCHHTQDTVSVPIEDGVGERQIRVSRC